ncbi:hypothetical protein YH62_21995 [Rhizobium sp. LC145]|jgi:hypothetical protein|nr:hypothetical protein YH62_21995 [Rhizobium sp. LC145]
MAKPTWICAGCDVQFTTRKIDEWRVLRVEITSIGETSRLNEAFELCPDCQQRIVRLADPRNWPRQGPESADDEPQIVTLQP